MEAGDKRARETARRVREFLGDDAYGAAGIGFALRKAELELTAAKEAVRELVPMLSLSTQVRRFLGEEASHIERALWKRDIGFEVEVKNAENAEQRYAFEKFTYDRFAFVANCIADRGLSQKRHLTPPQYEQLLESQQGPTLEVAYLLSLGRIDKLTCDSAAARLNELTRQKLVAYTAKSTPRSLRAEIEAELTRTATSPTNEMLLAHVAVEIAQLSDREQKILAVIQRGAKGLQYCRELDAAGIGPQRKGSWSRCPRKYASAYQAGRPWRHMIQDEKCRIKRKSLLAR